MSADEYSRLTAEWIQAAENCLAADGVMAIHVPDDVVSLVLQSAKIPRIAWISGITVSACVDAATGSTARHTA